MNLFKSIASAIKSLFVTPDAGDGVIARPEWHEVLGSSFADPDDVRRFKECKRKGGTDQECFKVGDNGIGYTGMLCMRDDVAYVALPPEDLAERWGTAKAAAGKRVLVKYNGLTIEAFVGDRMPARKNIKNGCGIDMNPGTLKKLGLHPPVKVRVSWAWAE